MSADRNEPWLIALAADIAEARPVDWARAAGQASDPVTRRLVEQLRHVAEVMAAHQGAAPDAPEAPEPVPDAPAAREWMHLVLLERVGVGAFGEVYRGWDTRLDREVAVKLLPRHRVSQDAPLKEARLLARIRHPNVVTVYGAAEDEEYVGVWMEFIEGETLAAQVRQRGPLSARETAGIGIDLCRALSALHAAGLVHRDIKAHNVMREVGGRLVLMDFSGARALGAGEAPDRLSGTPLYMAPELFAGQPASIAAEIYSLGVLLFFLLTGQHPVNGANVAEIRDAHRRRTRLRLRDLRPELAEALVQVVERATAPEPATRHRTAGELEHALAGSAGLTAVGPGAEGPARDGARRAMPPRLTLAAILLMLVVVLALVGVWRVRAPPAAQMLRFAVGPPYNAGSWPRVSPDGARLVFGVLSEGQQVLWMHRFADVRGQALRGTSARDTPFWSPDSRALAFFADGKLRILALAGGEIRTVAEAPRPRGGDWNREGVLLLAPSPDAGIHRLRADGTGLAQVTRLDASRAEVQHAWPTFLPDGRRFLFVAHTRQEGKGGVYVGALDSPRRKWIMPPYSRVAFAPPDFLVFARDGVLMAQRFDVEDEELRGDPVPLASAVKSHPGGDVAADVSWTDVLVYRLAEGLISTRLVLFDRRGREVAAITPPALYRQPRFSPDGQRIAAARAEESRPADIWVFDVARASASRFTTNAAADLDPVWSPDGRRIAFSSQRAGTYELYVKDVDGTEDERLIMASDGDKFVADWSANGHYLSGTVAGSGLWVLPLSSGSMPSQVRGGSAGDPRHSAFSPDSRWLAYTASDSGSPEVYVEPFPGTGERWQVSSAGGADPQWRGDGRELFYLAPDDGLMAVDVRAGVRFRAGAPHLLFRVSVPELLGPSDYSATRDGQLFVVNTVVADPLVPPVHVVLNWSRLLPQ